MLAAPAVRDRALAGLPPVAAAAFAAAAFAVLLYLPALQFGFVFDDLSLLTPTGEPVALGGALPYRPVRYASYLVDWSLGGSAAVFHLHNVILHAAVAALTALVAVRLGAVPLAAFAGALVVSLHPMSVEVAAYVAGRRDLLCVTFGLASLLAQLGGRPRTALLLLVCSVGAKESGLVFAAPLAAAIVAGQGSAGVLVRRLAMLLLVTAASLSLSILYGAVGPWFPEGGFASSGRVLLHYASGLAGLRTLAPEYPELFATAAGHVPTTLATLAAMVLLLAAIVRSVTECARARRDKEGSGSAVLLAWVAAAAAALALWGGVHEPGADRHAYLLLPALGVAASLLLTGALTGDGSGARASARIALATVVLLVATVASLSSREQMRIWSSERALWGAATQREGASTRAHANFARAVAADGDLALARRHLTAALDAGGDDGTVYASRAALRCAEGKRQLAQRDVRRAFRAGARPLVEGTARECGLSLRAGMHLSPRRAGTVEASGK